MARNLNRVTVPEKAVRPILHRFWCCLRLHAMHCPGKTEIVIHRMRKAVLFNRCLWQMRSGSNAQVKSKSNSEFRKANRQTHVRRDERHEDKLMESGLVVPLVLEREVEEAGTSHERIKGSLDGFLG